MLKLKLTMTLTDDTSGAKVSLPADLKLDPMDLKPAQELPKVVRESFARMSIALADRIETLGRPVMDAAEEASRDSGQGGLFGGKDEG